MYIGGSPEKKGNRNYGFGWRLKTIDNQHKIVYHSGWWRGYNTLFVRLPYRQSTIVFLANKRNKQFMRTYHQILSILDPEVFPPVTGEIDDEL